MIGKKKTGFLLLSYYYVVFYFVFIITIYLFIYSFLDLRRLYFILFLNDASRDNKRCHSNE